MTESAVLGAKATGLARTSHRGDHSGGTRGRPEARVRGQAQCHVPRAGICAGTQAHDAPEAAAGQAVR